MNFKTYNYNIKNNNKNNRRGMLGGMLGGIFCLLLFGATVSLAANDTPADGVFSLDRLIALAREHSPAMKMAALDPRIAHQEFLDARAPENPEFEFAAGKFRAPGQPGSSGAAIRETGVSWAMPNPFYRHYLIKGLRADVNNTTIAAEIHQREIIRDLTTHYRKLCLHTKIVSFRQEKLERLKDLHHIISSRASVGEIREIDRLRSSVEILKAETALFRAQQDTEHEKIMINRLLGGKLPEHFTVNADFKWNSNDPDPHRLREQLELSPLVRLKSNDLEKQSALKKSATWSILESIEVFAEEEHEVEGKKWKVGAGISVPLFNRRNARIRAAKLQQQKARLALEQARQGLLAEVRGELARLRTLEKEINNFESTVLDQGRRNIHLSERLYKEGEVPLMVLLDARDSFSQVQERYYEAITEWFILKAGLDALLGEKTGEKQ